MKLMIAATALTLVSILSPRAHAQASTIISDRDVVLPVEVSPSTVRYTNAGYSSFMVKILIPALADVTLLNHRNQGEDAPCMATFETNDIDDLTRGGPSTENVTFNIKLRKIATPDLKANICRVTVVEDIAATIKGLAFFHTRFGAVENRHIDDCR